MDFILIPTCIVSYYKENKNYRYAVKLERIDLTDNAGDTCQGFADLTLNK